MLSVTQIKKPIDCIQLNNWLKEIFNGYHHDILKAQLTQSILYNLKNYPGRTLQLFADLIIKCILLLLTLLDIKLRLWTPLQKVCIFLSGIFKDYEDEFLIYEPSVSELYVSDLKNRKILKKFCSKVIKALYTMTDNFEYQDYIFEVFESIEHQIQKDKKDDFLKVALKKFTDKEEVSQLNQLIQLKLNLSKNKFSLDPDVFNLSKDYDNLLKIMNNPQNKKVQLEAIGMMNLLLDCNKFNKKYILSETQNIVEKAFEKESSSTEETEELEYDNVFKTLYYLLALKSDVFAEAVLSKYHKTQFKFEKHLSGMKLIMHIIIQQRNKKKRFHEQIIMQVLEKYIQLITIHNHKRYFIYFRTNFQPLIKFYIVEECYPEL